ncbi:sigma factor-like helix-turn-helix DNA-binding protein [Streptomyces vinaceus]|uniref:sigma factor-like helix-turn-helix DNA-binding protein n=1 Tax=Streptomyces vinaceus TaxID=1960 RepID=UPI0035DE752F
MPLREEIPMTPVHQGFAPGSPGVIIAIIAKAKMATKKPELYVRATKKTEDQPSVFSLRACRSCPPLCDTCWRKSTVDASQHVRCLRARVQALMPTSSVTTTLVAMPLPLDDPITLYLYGLAWEKATERLPGPPRSASGPVTSEEHLALLATLSEFSAGLESNVLTATYYACEFKVSQAEVGRACGISRQAVRQRLAKAVAAREEHRRKFPYWDYEWDGYSDYE